jgi:Fur family iron response transcriptional regulator
MTQSSQALQKAVTLPAPATSEVGDYTWHNVRQRLRAAGVRPTRQRVTVAWLLFRKGHRHVTAEVLHEEAASAKVPVSLATVYNTLNQFRAAGLLRQIAVDGPKKYFDTNTSEHHHFLLDDQNELVDVSASELSVGRMPTPPDGYEITRVDLVFRLRRKSG